MLTYNLSAGIRIIDIREAVLSESQGDIRNIRRCELDDGCCVWWNPTRRCQTPLLAGLQVPSDVCCNGKRGILDCTGDALRVLPSLTYFFY